MKRIVETPKTVERVVEKVVEMQVSHVEDNESAFVGLLGKEVAIFSAVYIYSGKLTGVNGDCVALSNAKLVYETGAFSDKHWKDAQALPAKEVYIQKSLIESFFEVVR